MYRVLLGKNRYLAGLELGFKSFPVLVVPDKDIEVLKAKRSAYIDIEGFKK